MSNLMERACLTAHGEGVVLRLWVSPNASRTAVEGLRQDRLNVRVKAPPVEGKANAEVCRWAAKTFNLRASRVSVLRGEHARQKDLLLSGVGLAEVERLVDALLESK